MLEKLSLKAPTGIDRIVSENKDINATIIKTGIIPFDLLSFFRHKKTAPKGGFSCLTGLPMDC